MKITLVRNTKKNDLRLSLKTFEQLLQQMADEKTGNRVEAFREAVSQLYDGYSHYKDMDTWTHVYPAAEYVKDGNGNLLFQKSTGLLLLSFSNLADVDGIEEAKRSAAFLPSTFAAVESTDGLGIHILVKYTDDDGELVEEEAAATAKIMTWNSRYQVEQPIEQCFFDSFTVAKDKTEGQYMSVAAIYKELKSKYGATLVGNSLISFGRKLKNIDGITHRHSSNSTEYLIVRRY